MAPPLHSVEIGEGHPLLILHGGGLDHRHMRDALEPAFDDRPHFRRVYADLPGHGLSDGQGINSQDDVLSRLISFSEHTFDGPFAVIGESRGSLLARGLVAERPDLLSGVCLIAPGGDAPSSVKPAHETLVGAPDVRATLPLDAQQRFDRLVVQTRDIAQKIIDTKLPAAALADKAAAERIARNFDLTIRLESETFDRPSLIIAARQDAIAGYEDATAIQTHFPRSTFAILDTAGHSLSWERPALFKALLTDWLDRLSAGL